MTRLPSLQFLLRLGCLILCLSSINAYTALSDSDLRKLPGSKNDFDIKTGKLLAPILIPRVSGTDGSTKVLNHIVDFFKTELPKWTIEFQNSTSKTPATGDKDVSFINIIATRDPPWTSPGQVGHLAMVAHYDSKLTPTGFIGATDSAAPCAMLMHAARSIDFALTAKWEVMQAEGANADGFEEDKGIQILFLDGEESFLSWTDTDSLYGARSLAAEWESTPHPALSTFRTPLASIELFCLLDLLGAKNPRIPSYFKTTHWAYKKMAGLEDRLRSLSLFVSQDHPFLVDSNKDENRWTGGMVLDDHVPFMDRGVEVLHIIPTPFPRVWHDMKDDGEHLDIDTVKDWALLATAFMAEWMDLDGYIEMREKLKPKSEL
jgi:glutaminyl-peptide cyclotransferase